MEMVKGSFTAVRLRQTHGPVTSYSPRHRHFKAFAGTSHGLPTRV